MASLSVERYMFSTIAAKITELENKAASTQGKPGSKPGIGTPGSTPGGGSTGGGTKPPASGSKYTVVSGDSLSLIAGRFYGDVLLWPVIYDANKQVVGSNPNLIQVGQRFTIPSIDGYSQSQLSSIRQRGKNC